MDQMDSTLAIKTVQQVVERILSTNFGCAVRTTVSRITEEGRRNQVFRCQLHVDTVGFPQSVIVKQAMQGNGIWNDWAGVQFLSELEAFISPRYYGGDRESRLVIIEDIDDGKGIHETLLNGTAAEGRAMLLKFALVTGQMHARTAGRYLEYDTIRTELGCASSQHSTSRLSDGVRRTLTEVADLIDLRVEDCFYEELSSIGQKMLSPGPFYVFSHGDPCPDNWLCNEEVTKLIDYEFAAYKHALLDGSYGQIMFPTCWCAGSIPETLISEMEKLYREELARGCAEASDDATFRTEMVSACAFWTWNTVETLLKVSLERSKTWGIATTRARIVSRLEVLISMSVESNIYPSIRSVSQHLYEIVSSLWPEDKLQLYPCFRS